MKYIFLTMVFVLCMGANIRVSAQDTQDKEEKMEALKIAFITKRLELSPKEAQVFWPIYNEYSDKLEGVRKDRRRQYKNSKEKMDVITDKEAEALVDSEMAFRQKELDIQKDYHNQFKKALPIKKVAKLYMAEEGFKRHLLKKLQEQNKQ